MKIIQKQLVTMYGAKGINIISTIIATPIGLNYFGVEQYGLLALIWTLLTFLNMSSFGLPSALKSYLAVYSQKNNRIKIVSMVLKLYLPICVVLLFILYFLDETYLLVMIGNNLPDYLQKLAANTILVAALLFIINLPFSSFLEGFAGIQKIHYSTIYEVLISLTILLTILIVVNKNLGLYEFFLIRGVLNLIINAVGLLHFLYSVSKSKHGNNDGSVVNFRLTNIAIVKMSLTYFYTGIAALIVWHTDNLIIAKMYNLELVGVYSLNFRLVTTFFILFTTISSVFNPWFGKYYGENDIKRVAKGVKVCLLTTTIGSALIFIFVSLFGKDIMNVWLGKPEYFDKGIIFSLCAYGMSLSVVHTSMALASATGSIKKLPYIAFFEAIANLFFSLILSYYFGVFGVALGTFFAALVTTFWMIPYFCLKPIFKDTWNLFLPAMKHFLFINLPIIVTVIILITYFDTQRYLLLYKSLILIMFIASNWFVLLSTLKKNKTLLRSEV